MTQSIQKLAKETTDTVVVRGDSLLWRMAEYIPLLNHFVAQRERSLAREQCAKMLELFRAVQAEHPGLAGEPLYERVVARRLSCDDAKARELVRLADLSFAQWPDERDVNFRDVVNFVFVNQIMSAHARAMGIHVDMAQIVNAGIPEGL